MPKKTVLFLASWYPNRGNLFLGHFVQGHAEAACEIADIKVLFATSSEDARDFEMERNTVNGVDTLVVYYPKVKLPIPGAKQLISRKRYLRALKMGFSVLDTHFDLVHLNEAFPAGIFARFLKRKYRINYILTVHWTGYLNHTRTFKKLPAPTKAIHRQIFAGASEITPVSDHLGKSLVSLGLANKYKVIPNVVNEKIFYPASAKDASASPRFLHVSSFDDDHKNIRGMFLAFENLQNSGVDFFLHFVVECSKSEVWNRIDEYGLDREKCE
ncbi:MAG: glycosyltransferase, partial [Flavobacteriales bacterium]|nr:glycosyltransferase [Flavobacteriales bacterium]